MGLEGRDCFEALNEYVLEIPDFRSSSFCLFFNCGTILTGILCKISLMAMVLAYSISCDVVIRLNVRSLGFARFSWLPLPVMLVVPAFLVAWFLLITLDVFFVVGCLYSVWATPFVQKM